MAIKWSRDRWRHVILKGQGRDPNMLRAQYLENGWRYRDLVTMEQTQTRDPNIRLERKNLDKKAVLSQGIRAMPL